MSRVTTVALLLLFAFVARAQKEAEQQVTPEPPAVEPLPNTLNTRLSGSWQSEIFLSQRPRMRALSGGRYGVRSENVYPFYNTISLRADEVGHPGLSIHFQGWAGLDLADVYFDQRFVADPTYLYLQFRHLGLDARVGRQMVFSGAAQGLRIDGANVSYQTPFYLGFQALGGLVVSPKYGPDWYRGQEGDDWEDWNAGGFSDWEREGEFGDYAAGGRLFYRMAGSVSAGLSFVHTTRNKEVDRQVAGADLDVVPADWIAVTGDALLAIPVAELMEANAGVDVFPSDLISFGVDYRHADPTLYISRMSIFSVFSNEKFDAVGGAVRVFPLGWLALHGAYHHHFYRYIQDTDEDADAEAAHQSALEMGYEVEGGVRATSREIGALALLDYRRIRQDLNGVHQLRLGGSIPIAKTDLRAGGNVFFDIYDEELSEQGFGVLGDVSLHWRRENWTVGGAFTAGMTPYAEHELRGLVKASYNFNMSFSERRQP